MSDITAPPLAGYVSKPVPVDVIVTTSGDLSWLSQWKAQLSSARIIVAHDASVKVTAPAGFEGIQYVSGTNSGALGPRDLAVLAAKSQRILFLSDGASPATSPTGETVKLLLEHSYNLDTPATPSFFNTLYDPFRPGTDFVRGYPFSLRDGVKTAVSHGSVLGQPDLDAATQLAKPQARNTRYVDATLTVPKEALVSLSARNLAMDRSLIGVATYAGLGADGQPQGADADNTWTSFCIKALCNHLGYGCKTGLPYIVSSRPPATPAAVEAEKHLMKWQDAIVEFFRTVKLSATSTTPEAAYTELASKVRQQLGPVDAYFVKLADAMEAWVKAYTTA